MLSKTDRPASSDPAQTPDQPRTRTPPEEFRDVVFDQHKYDHAMSWAPAAIRYAIFFTPRSGSSRLTDLASRTGALSTPGECFNKAFVPPIAQTYSARTLQDYVALLLRHRKTGNTFGCEVTFDDIDHFYSSGQAFLDALRPTATIWLLREDIIAQAVSISRLMQTKVSHSVMADDGAIAQAEQDFTYDPKVIASVIQRIRSLETRTEALIRDAGLAPLRISYEETVAMRPRRLMAVIGTHVGVPPRHMDLDGLDSDHRKVSGAKSDDFAARFRDDHPDLVARVDAERAAMLTAHASARLTRRRPAPQEGAA